MEKQPHRGCLAICSNGSLGLITSNTPIAIPFKDNPGYVAWSGIQVSPSQDALKASGRVVGDTWCSSKPIVLFTADELRALADEAMGKKG